MKLLLGDCLDKLKELENNSVDSIVTDPPYGLSFMGKTWDYDVPSQQIWEECIRVLKPGGHLLAFAGSRTYHRMAVRIEDAGFEIRDQIMWIYGSGFPKSMDISKQIDKKFGAEREVIGVRTHGNIGGGAKTYDDDAYIWDKPFAVTAPATDEAKQWNGWGTALKPAHEPIVMARKPLSEKTVGNNVLEWGTGGINVDESRISVDENEPNHINTKPSKSGDGSMFGIGGVNYGQSIKGRFPANVIFDEEAGKILDEQSGISKQSGKLYEGKDSKTNFGQIKSSAVNTNYGDIGGASRFFYCPKTSKAERNQGTDNNHPTVKPTDLMLYLIRLVTPKGGVILDPFMGSGSTGKAAIRGGFDFIGIEREKEYMDIAEARINYEINKPSKTTKSNVSKKVEEKVNQFFG